MGPAHRLRGAARLLCSLSLRTPTYLHEFLIPAPWHPKALPPPHRRRVTSGSRRCSTICFGPTPHPTGRSCPGPPAPHPPTHPPTLHTRGCDGFISKLAPQHPTPKQRLGRQKQAWGPGPIPFPGRWCCTGWRCGCRRPGGRDSNPRIDMLWLYVAHHEVGVSAPFLSNRFVACRWRILKWKYFAPGRGDYGPCRA